MAEDKTHTIDGVEMLGEKGILSNILLLQSLSAIELAEFAQKCSWTQHKSGVEIIDRTSESREMYFVVSGRVRVVNYSLSGREVAYAILEEGSYFGEIAAIDGQPRSAHVISMEPVILAAAIRKFPSW
jgi:CRP/FNR family cyclic AMP-dependent transcriptional regulator